MSRWVVTEWDESTRTDEVVGEFETHDEASEAFSEWYDDEATNLLAPCILQRDPFTGLLTTEF